MGLGIKLIGEGGIRSYRKIGAIVGMVPIVDRETCRVKGNDTADEQGTAMIWTRERSVEESKSC